MKIWIFVLHSEMIQEYNNQCCPHYATNAGGNKAHFVLCYDQVSGSFCLNKPEILLPLFHFQLE